MIIREETHQNSDQRCKQVGGRKKKDGDIAGVPGIVSPNMIESHKMAIVGHLFRGIAHDMKNPLSVILQGSEFLEFSDPADDSRKKILEMIRKAASRIDGMIEDILSFARPSGERSQISDMRTLIDESIALLGPQLSTGYIQVSRDYPPSLPECKVNRSEIKLALVSVLMNAADAIPEDGIVSIEVKTVMYESGKKSVAIMITDNGCGIPEDDLGRICEPFFTTKTDRGRIGLGLAVVRDIIERHKGYLSIESRAGQSTSVLLVLPAILP
jgi:two-component system NtrC family sensor kinase